jgi:hypothetical protein
VSASATATRAWRTHIWSHTTALTEVIRSRDDEGRDQIAADLAGLPDHDRVWGRRESADTGGHASER